MPDSEFIVEPIEPGVFPPGTYAWKTYAVPVVVVDAQLGSDGFWFVPAGDK